jgi:hypothetical protein
MKANLLRNFAACLLVLLLACAFQRSLGASPTERFSPGTLWNDTQGNRINAHGGGVIFHDGRYYWFGEHKLAGRSEAQRAGGGVHCYSSANLSDWKDEGLVLSVNYTNRQSDIAAGCILERPKVVFNAETRTFVMFFKLYPIGTGYDIGYVGVATAKNVSGPFTYRHKFLGGSSPKGTGDFAIVRGDDGAMYHLAVRKPDKAFVAGRLRSDFLFSEGEYKLVEGIEHHTEAPAIVRRAEGFYLLGSGSTGWKPNAARSFFSTNLTGPYMPPRNPVMGVNPHNQLGPEKTFGGQISYIIPVVGKTNAYIAMFDQWKPEAPIEGGYIWLPLVFESGKPVVRWRDEWDLFVFGGK